MSTDEVLPDPSTGKQLAFTAYSYARADGSTGYAVLQHLGNHKGALAVWSQE